MEIFRVLESCTVNEIIDFIYKNKEEAKVKSKSGRTALHALFYPDKASKFVELFVREKGMEYEDLNDYEPDKCLAPIVNALLDVGVDPNAVDDYGETALHELCERMYGDPNYCYAAILFEEQEKLNAMRALIAGGADPNIKNKYGRTAYDSLPSDKKCGNCPSFILGNCKKKETAQ